MSSSSPEPWIPSPGRQLWHTRVFDVRATPYQHPSRSESKEFIVIDAPDWAVVAPVTPEGELILVQQFRFGANAMSLELPGGVIEPGEDPTTAAVRELAEETGYRGGAPVVLGKVYSNPAIQNNRTHLILVPDVTLQQATEWDTDEEIEISRAPISEVLKAARRGEITHALMLNLLFLLEPWWQERFGSHLT